MEIVGSYKHLLSKKPYLLFDLTYASIRKLEGIYYIFWTVYGKIKVGRKLKKTQNTFFSYFTDKKSIQLDLKYNMMTVASHGSMVLANTFYIHHGNMYIVSGAGTNDAHKVKYSQGIYLQQINHHQLKLIGAPQLILNKSLSKSPHPGTKFDSQSSLVFINDIFYLYTRFNVKSGIRKTQVFISEKNPSEDINSIKWEKSVLLELPFNTYTSNIFVYKNKIHGLFMSYNGLSDCPYKISRISYGISEDGVNFKIVNNSLFKDNIFPVGGFIEEEDGLYVYFQHYVNKNFFIHKLE